MSLRVWNSATDPYDHEQLAYNWLKVDQHDHAEGRGTPIPSAGLQDGAITENKIYPGSVGSSAIANGAITTTKVADSAITTPKVAFQSITHEKVALDTIDHTQIQAGEVRDQNLADGAKIPVGTVINWYRPNTSTPLPAGWVECIGQSVAAAAHDFVGGGTITVPDMRNRFILGAATNGASSPGSSQTPAIGATGGSHTLDLAHTHGFAHHHVYTMVSHTHGVTVSLPDHYHQFAGVGPYQFATSGGQHDVYAWPSWVPASYEAVNSGNADSDTYSDYYMLKAQAGHAGAGANTTGRIGGNDSTGGSTNSISSASDNATYDTTGSRGTPNGSDDGSARTTTDLGTKDIRPGFIGLIYLMKVKNA